MQTAAHEYLHHKTIHTTTVVGVGGNGSVLLNVLCRSCIYLLLLLFHNNNKKKN